MKAGTSFWIITCMAREGCLVLNIGKVQKQVILFLAGFVLGVLYIYMIGCRETDFLGIQSLMQISFLEIGYREYFLYLLKKRGLLGIGIVLIGMTAAGQLLLAGIVMYFGMSIGGMLSVMILRYGWKGILLSLSFCLPQDLFYIPAGSMGISLLAARGGQKSDRMPGYHMGEKKKNRLKQIFLMLGVTIIGILAECYVNPMLVKTVLKIF